MDIFDEELKMPKKPKEEIKWQEITNDYIEDHEDEIRALQKAKNEFDKECSDSDDEKMKKKRKRHDTDDEESEEKPNNTDDELDELLPQQDEDGDIILEENLPSDKNLKKNGLLTLNEYKSTVIKNIIIENKQ